MVPRSLGSKRVRTRYGCINAPIDEVSLHFDHVGRLTTNLTMLAGPRVKVIVSFKAHKGAVLFWVIWVNSPFLSFEVVSKLKVLFLSCLS